MNKLLLPFFMLLLICSTASAQTRQITGKVTDKSGKDAIPGASVIVKGTKVSVSTDDKGQYKIAVPTSGNTILIARYVGYKTQEITVGTQSKINFILEEDVSSLDEVVINIGYGTVKKRNLTGAVSSVGAEVIAAAPVSSALEAITGRVAGVSIGATEGSPDAEITVRVRGGGSITGSNAPLYIVDGSPVNSISDIAPQDIETIDILKDGASAAIYGSRGANGVVMVTTKNSKDGKTSIAYNAFTGVKELAKKLDVLTPYDYVSWQYERSLLDNSPTDYTKYFGNFQDMDLYADLQANDWQNIVFGRTGTTFNQNISVSGGGEKTKFTLSHSFVKDKAIMQLSDYQRQNVSFKLNHKLYKGLTLDATLRYSDTKVNGGGTNEQNEVSTADSRLKFAMIYPPFTVPGLTTTTETDDDFNLYSPIVALSDNNQYLHRKNYSLIGGVTYNATDELQLRSEVGYDGGRIDKDRFYGNTTYYVRNVPSADNQNLPALILAGTERNTFRNTNTINYNFSKILNKDHNLTLLLGQELIKGQERVLTSTVHGFPESFTFDNARKLSTQGKANAIDNHFAPDYNLVSFFTRASYDYKGKYLATAIFRADGSSKFGDNNKWGYFPSLSVAWRASQEGFMESTKSWLNDLKFRASIASSGNDAIPSGQMSQTFQNTVTTWVNGYGNYWAPDKRMANPDLKWETTYSRNIGVDFAILDSKVTGTIDAYSNRTHDLLLELITAGTGYDSQITNIGKTQNNGIEFALNWNAVRKTNFDLSFSGNISFNKNKIISLGPVKNMTASSSWASTEIGADFLVEEGFSIGRIYGYKNDGRYEVSDFDRYDATSGKWILKPGVVDATSFVGTVRPGTMKIVDSSGDGKIDLSDRNVIGNTNPIHTGGFSINSRVYNFDIGAYFNWSYGNDIYNANKIEYTSTSKYSSRNMISTMAAGNRWNNLRVDGTISNDAAELEAMNANTTLWSPYMKTFVLSDWGVEDGSFLRLSTLTLGYTLPKVISEKVKMKKLRIYASAYNLWMWTNYSGFDPEVSTRRKTNLTPGVDYSAYPRSKSFVFGLNVNF